MFYLGRSLAPCSVLNCTHARFSWQCGSLTFAEFSSAKLLYIFLEHSFRSNRRSILAAALSPSALCYCCAFAFVSARKYHAIAAHIANYISIEFPRNGNFVPLPTLRQLKYVRPNVKPLTVELLRHYIPLCFRSQICNNTVVASPGRFIVTTLLTGVSRRNLCFSKSQCNRALVNGFKY